MCHHTQCTKLFQKPILFDQKTLHQRQPAQESSWIICKVSEKGGRHMGWVGVGGTGRCWRSKSKLSQCDCNHCVRIFTHQKWGSNRKDRPGHETGSSSHFRKGSTYSLPEIQHANYNLLGLKEIFISCFPRVPRMGQAGPHRG